MLSNIGQPQLIWFLGGEIPLDQIVMHRRSDLAVLAALLTEHTPPAVVRADPPRGPLSHRLTGDPRLLDQVPIPELRVIGMGVEQRVSPIRLDAFGVDDRRGPPPVIRLAGELEYPPRHRHGDPVGSELIHERVEPFPGRLACDRYAAARRSTSFSCSNNLIRRRAPRSSADSLVLLPGLAPSSISA
jgi:hypothetical protein